MGIFFASARGFTMQVQRFAGKISGIIVLSVLTASAQAPPAARLRGKVADENGVPVAAVEILVRSPSGEIHRTFSDEAGQFELFPLRAGEVKVDLGKPGFFHVADEPVRLTGGLNEVSFTLSHEFEVHEKVEVTSSPTRIDTQETAHRATLVAHEIRDVPVPATHNLKNSLPILAPVLPDNSGELHIAGARVGEAKFLLDGFEIGDPAGGELNARVNVDAVRAVEVQTGPYGAEYAHAGAAVLALDTTPGDDRWRFGTTNFIPGINFDQGAHFGNWYPRFTFSGPLRRGRAWFSEAASLQHIFKVISEQPRGANAVTQWAGDNLLRLQLNLAPAHILQASFLYNRESDSHLGLGPFAPLATTTDLHARRYFVALKDQVWWRRVLFEIGGAFDTGRSDSLPRGSSPYVVAPTATVGNFFETLLQRSRRWQGTVSAALPSRRWHGSHELQTGVNADALRLIQSAVRNPIEFRRADGTLSQRATFSGSADARLSNTQLGAYAQDSWRIFRPLLVQLGLRGDWDHILRRGLAEPHVAANLLPFRDDRAKLSLAWGIYAEPVQLPLLELARDQQRADVFLDSTGTTPVLGPVFSRFALPLGGLRQPRFYASSVEWSQKLGAATLAAIHFLARDERAGLAFEDSRPAQPGGAFLLSNHRHDRYRSVELSLRHTFGESAEISGSYTRSRARSNEVLDDSLRALFFSAQLPGPLAWDAPNRLLSDGWAPAPIWHLLVSYFFEYRTGFPFTVINQQQQLVGPPNRQRFPDYLSLNLGLEKRFHFRGHEWAARLSAINITGHRNPNTVVNNIDAPNFLALAGGQGRALSARLRLVGRK